MSNNWLVLKEKARRQALRRNTQTIYVPVEHHIYFDGLSYRVRVTKDGVRTSKNFDNRRNACRFRDELLHA